MIGRRCGFTKNNKVIKTITIIICTTIIMLIMFGGKRKIYAEDVDDIISISFEFPSEKNKTITESSAWINPKTGKKIYYYDEYLDGGILTVEYKSGKKQKLTYGQWGTNGNKGMRNYGFLDEKGVDPFYEKEQKEYDLGDDYTVWDSYKYYIDKNQNEEWKPGTHYFTVRFYMSSVSVDIPVTIIGENLLTVASLDFKYKDTDYGYVIKNTCGFQNGMYNTYYYDWRYILDGGILTLKMSDGTIREYEYSSYYEEKYDGWAFGFDKGKENDLPTLKYDVSSDQNNGIQWTTKSADCHFELSVEGKKCTIPIKIVDSVYDIPIIHVENINNEWKAIHNGFTLHKFTGFGKNQNNWWYVKEGFVDFTKNGYVYGIVNGWSGNWFVENGKVTNPCTCDKEKEFSTPVYDGNSIIKTKYKGVEGWYYLKNGKVMADFTGFVSNRNGWWYVEKGKITFEKNGIIEGSLNETYGRWYVQESQIKFVDTVAKDEKGWWRIKNGRVNDSYTGLAQNANGWWYIKNGKVDFSFTGLAENYNGWWYVNNGKVDFNKNDVVKGEVYKEKGWWVVQNGKVNLQYTGFSQNTNGWWYCEKGKVNLSKRDIIKGKVNNQDGWWYVNGGKVQFVDSVERNSSGWWCIHDGRVDMNYTGFEENSSGWWYCEKGKVDFSKNGLIKGVVTEQNGWWYVSGGKVKFINSVEKNASGWWCIKNGKVDFNYNGFASNANGWWYCEKGKVDFTMSGIVKGIVNGEGNWWYVRNGKVDLNYKGFGKNNSGWWYCEEGKVDFSKEGLFKGVVNGQNGWWYVKNGKVDFGYTGFAYNLDCWWYCEKGKVDFSKNEVMKGKVYKYDGWWYVSGGKVDFDFTGIGANKNGQWYCSYGIVSFEYTGYVEYNNKVYWIVDGKVQ